MKKLNQKTRAGFTLIETMIGVTIITLSISGPLLAASRAVVLAQISRDQLTASYLAQEAIEYVRAMRDDAYLHRYTESSGSAAAWADFVSGAQNWSITQCITTACTFDPARPMGYGSTFSLNEYSGNAPLYLNNDIYTQQQIGTRTPFTRTVQAVVISDTEVSITATVTWNSHSSTYTITITDHLTPWQ